MQPWLTSVSLRQPLIAPRSGPRAERVLALTAWQAPRAAAPASGSSSASFAGRTLNIVTGRTGGVYIVYGARLADILSKMGEATAA